MCKKCQDKYKDSILLMRWRSEALRAECDMLEQYKKKGDAIWQGGNQALLGCEIVEMNENLQKIMDSLVSVKYAKILLEKCCRYVEHTWAEKRACSCTLED